MLRNRVYIKTRFFLPAAAGPFVLFPSIVFVVHPEFWATTLWLPASNPVGLAVVRLTPTCRSHFNRSGPTTRRCTDAPAAKSALGRLKKIDFKMRVGQNSRGS
jgi:hypothetical protein